MITIQGFSFKNILFKANWIRFEINYFWESYESRK